MFVSAEIPCRGQFIFLKEVKFARTGDREQEAPASITIGRSLAANGARCAPG